MSIRRQLRIGGESVSAKHGMPPEKPPRGHIRRGPVRIEPLGINDNVDNKSEAAHSPALSHYKFSTTEKYLNMKNYFRDVVHGKNGDEFSGFEAVNILDEYIQTNREQFSAHVVRRENAIKVLDMWLRENVIRQVNSSFKDSPPPFSDSKKVMYALNPDEDHRLYICSTPTTCNNPSVCRRPSRTSSFKRFFSPNRAKVAEISTQLVGSSMKRSYSSSSEPATRSAPRARQCSGLFTVDSPGRSNKRSLREEAELHDAALFRLLTVVEIPMLDDLTAVPGQPTKSASILSTILSKIGLGSSHPDVISANDEEMDDLLEETESIRPLLPWFQLARVCAPSLYFSASGTGKPSRPEVHSWAKASLQAVSDRLSTITHRGSSPLFPVEFSPVIEAIIQQLLGKRKKKTKLALQYLFLMIPQKLREHLINVVMFLERTMDTDEWVSLRDPFFLGKKGGIENYIVAFDELRSFIFPRNIDRLEQYRLMEAMIELRKEGDLGRVPTDLAADLKKLRESADKSMVPLRFCKTESTPDEFNADAEVAKTLRAIIDNAHISLAEKQRKCELFRQHHPKIYEKYFPHLKY